MEAVVAFKYFQGFVSRDSHDRQVINASSPHIGNGGMAEVVKVEPFYSSSPAGCVECRFDGVNGFPFD